MKKYCLHLVSDSTGETVSSVARAALSQFEDIEVEERIWSLVRTRGQMERVIEGIREEPGPVLLTVVSEALRKDLQSCCRELGVPCIPILAQVASELSGYFGVKTMQTPGRQHRMDEEYFDRVEAINFTITHDDGQATWELEEADVVLVGVSRTSKTPTSVYLAYRGFYAANIPYVPGCPFPDEVTRLVKPLVVGLIITPERLIQIRKSRLLSLQQAEETDYIDMEKIKDELAESRKFFGRWGWPIIDVSRRSVEETAANIVQMIQERKEAMET